LQPEIELLNPAEGSRRLEPLENAAEEAGKTAKSLNVEYKMDLMKEKKAEAKNMQDRGLKVEIINRLIDINFNPHLLKAVQDMNKVRREVDQNINDMRVIADGLGSGVTPEQLNR